MRKLQCGARTGDPVPVEHLGCSQEHELVEVVRLVLALPLLASLASCSAWAPPGHYRLEPLTVQQMEINRESSPGKPAERFLTLMLPVAAGNVSTSYEHLLPQQPTPSHPLALKVRPLFFFEGSLARSHPFEPSLRHILIYWGCGEVAGKGQPRVINVDAVDDEQLTQLLAPSPNPTDSPGRLGVVSEAHRGVAYYSARIPEQAEVRGSHELRAGPTRTRFTVGEQGDFLPPVAITRVRGPDQGGTTIRWERTPGALAYFANMYVQRSNGPIAVIWTSSRVPEAGYLLSQGHPGGDELTRLLEKGVLMHADTQECTIPSAVMQHASHAMAIQVHTFGPETAIPATSSDMGLPSLAVRVAPRASTTILLLNPGH